MKRLMILVALAGVMLAGVCAAPAQAKGFAAKQRKLDREIQHRNQVELRRIHRWERKHPRATPKQHAKLSKWVEKHSRITNRIEQKKVHRATRGAHNRH